MLGSKVNRELLGNARWELDMDSLLDEEQFYPEGLKHSFSIAQRAFITLLALWKGSPIKPWMHYLTCFGNNRL
jgi:hypothetical protein